MRLPRFARNDSCMRLPRLSRAMRRDLTTPRNDTKGTIYASLIFEHVIFAFLAMTFNPFSRIILAIRKLKSNSLFDCLFENVFYLIFIKSFP